MVMAGCHEGKGIVCLDEANCCSPCNKDPKKCGWAKYPNIQYIFRSVQIENGHNIDIPMNALAISTGQDTVRWLEPNNRTGNK